MFPELGRLVGYAVTCVYGLPDPNFSELTFMDVVDALDAAQKPTVLVIEQKFPPEIADKVGLAGGNMIYESAGMMAALLGADQQEVEDHEDQDQGQEAEQRTRAAGFTAAGLAAARRSGTR